MKLPEKIPSELQESILVSVHNCKCDDCKSLLMNHYARFVDHFNNKPVDWKPVSEKPEFNCDVWLWDGKTVYKGQYINNAFIAQRYGIGAIADDATDDVNPYLFDFDEPTHWTHAYIPEPPKE